MPTTGTRASDPPQPTAEGIPASTVEFGFTHRGVAHRVWFRSHHRALEPGGGAFAAALFFPSLAGGIDRTPPISVDPILHHNLEILRDTFARWCRVPEPDLLARIPCPPRAHPPSTATAAFFTGGVDSFETLLAEGHRIDALVYVHGFDVPLDRHGLRARISRSLAAAARSAGKEFIEVETNLREVLDGTGIHWTWTHGAALASVAHLLAPHFGRILISATQSLDAPDPWGSHPFTDPLWGDSRLTLEHVGAQRTRSEKVRAIAGFAIARRHLRVCYENRGEAYNCGRCEKCVRTRVALEVVGALEHFPTLPFPLPRFQLARQEIADADGLYLLDENRRFAREQGASWDLRFALWLCRRQWLSRGLFRQARLAWARHRLGTRKPATDPSAG